MAASQAASQVAASQLSASIPALWPAASLTR